MPRSCRSDATHALTLPRQILSYANIVKIIPSQKNLIYLHNTNRLFINRHFVKHLYIILILFVSACVPGRRFDRVSNAYMMCKADSTRISDSLNVTNKQKGELILKVVSLQQDSIKKEQEFFNLQEQYNKLLANGSAEMASILRRMKQNEEENRRANNNRNAVVVYKGEVDKALDKLYNELTVKLYGIDKRNIIITKTNFAVKVSINETFLFTKPSVAISSRGSKVIDTIAQLFKERNLFNLHIVKTVPVGDLFGKMNSTGTTDIIGRMSALDQKIEELDRRSAAVNNEIGKLNARNNRLLAADSTLLVKSDSMMIATNNAAELADLMERRIEIGYSDTETDNANLLKARNDLGSAMRQSESIAEEHQKVSAQLSENKLALQAQQIALDSLSRQRDSEIESLNRIMHDIEATTETAQAADLNVLTSFIIKQCGSNLGENKITAERVFRADSTLASANKWIDIVIKPDMESITGGQQKNKNIYD